MRPPLTLDIGWGDLVSAGVGVLAARDAPRLACDVERLWSPRGDAIAALSVRSLLDLWLRTCAHPPGSEILMTAFTIADMRRIVERHGLVPVAVDLPEDTLSPTVEALEAGRTERTVGVIVAHLFGARSDLAGVCDWAERHGVAVLEDCAQAYAADGWTGDDRADLALFSFGTIKTATALGGGIARVRDPEIRERMRALLATDPPQSRWTFAKKVVKGAALRGLATPVPYGLFVHVCRLFGRAHDDVVRGAVRGFPGADVVAAVRRRPSAPLLRLLRRRLLRPPVARLQRRTAVGESLRARLGAAMPAASADHRTHWVLPVVVGDPAGVAERLRAVGLDPARTATATTIGDAPGCRSMEEHLLYVPCAPDLRDDELDRIADALR